MFPHRQLTGQGPTFPGVPEVRPASPRNYPDIWQTSSVSTPEGQIPSPPGKPPISLPTKRFQPVEELHRTDVAGIVNLPQLSEISYEIVNANYECDDSPDLGGAECNAPFSLK
jgi:hypothetical protein